jgi:hypothetical protein
MDATGRKIIMEKTAYMHGKTICQNIKSPQNPKGKNGRPCKIIRRIINNS